MKYEVIARATTEWAYTVEAKSLEAAERKLEAAINKGEEGELSAQVYDSGTLEVLFGQTSQIV